MKRYSRITHTLIILNLGMSLFTLSGCATIGDQFQFRGPESIVIGKTTRNEIRSAYGEPFRVGYENGATRWTYGYYQYRLFGSSDTKDLAITFDKKGIVSSYSYSSSDTDEVTRALK